MMLCGMALETIYKGVLVAQRKRPPESHDLIDIASRAGIAVSDRHKKALKLFEYALVWHGRYPAQKSKRPIDYYDYLDLRHEIGGNGNMEKVSDRIEAAIGWHGFEKLWSTAAETFFSEYDKTIGGRLTATPLP
jgi:hypothetical protein